MSNEDQIARLEHEQLASLINSMTDGVIALNKHLRVTLYNGAALNILDRNSSIQNKGIDSVLPLVDADKQPVIVSELIHTSKVSSEHRDYLLPYEDGSRAALYLSIAPVHNNKGEGTVEGYVLIMRDITHEKSIEEERNEFISVVSHELRTPVTIAEGSISNAKLVLERSADTELTKKTLESAHEQILFLASMINDLSTLSRADRSILAIDTSVINMSSLLQGLVDSYQESALQKSIQLSLHLSPQLETLTSSELYVKEILQNFITNAVKYTDEGSVQVEAKPAKDGIIVSIHDTGIGISKSDQEMIFEKFFRSEDYRTRKNSGTGLGLYVTMKLVKILGATLEVVSELDKGSTFTITFPNIKDQ